MTSILSFFSRYLGRITIPSIRVTDIVEILLIAYFVYQFIVWIKYTRAYSLLKGILLVAGFILVAYIFNMTTILWFVQNLVSVLLIGLIVIFQPELRKVLEQLGEKRIISDLFFLGNTREIQERFTDKTAAEIVRACVDMAEVKTGALIVIEQEIRLTEYERTGINIDAAVTSQLLVNIFEHNTPLHDGAVIIRGNRITAATCYLPLSDNMELSKKLGTRHRAGVGISEVTDSLTIIVSEETGKISIAKGGSLQKNVTAQGLREALMGAQNKTVKNRKAADARLIRKLLKGRKKNEE